ncbi:unnamed protein product [Notodromas monacha]|uniref:Decapping nuclease n=1 Tax=Notodromas monacha TaxID=399045 RepID=A0A7R9BN58_9CRUS|nr:unnamed protein product [Notodromas monacha]CAG0918585.1 unnamed protein product [Notodromas monacha]
MATRAKKRERDEHVGQRLPTNPQRYNGNFPVFKQPKIIGHFSLSNAREYFPDARNLGYFVAPACDLDEIDGPSGALLSKPMELTFNADATTKKDELLDEGLKHLFRWISLNKSSFAVAGAEHQRPVPANFVCFRGLFTKILATPFEGPRSNPWLIAATKFRGTIYLDLRKTDEDVQAILDRTDVNEKFTRWGYKFEQFLFASETRFDVDASSCIERRFKLLKWWAQQFTVGIPFVHVGWRDGGGRVKRVQRLKTQTMHHQAREFWTPQTCFNFLLSFLRWVKDLVSEDDPRVVYSFRWDPGCPGRPVVCNRLSDPEASKMRVIPEWFVQDLLDQRKT